MNTFCERGEKKSLPSPVPANEGRSWQSQDLLFGEQKVNNLGVRALGRVTSSIRQGRCGGEEAAGRCQTAQPGKGAWM